MFRFENPQYLYVLIALPVLTALFFFARLLRKRALRRLGEPSVIKNLMPLASRYVDVLKLILLLSGLAMLIIGWANPQWGTKKEKAKRKSVDVILALDISESMLAIDLLPNRLERAKRFVQDLVEALKGERLGAVIFAGNAYLQVPLTTDYAAVELFLKSANPSMAPVQGTAIADAIDLAEKAFDVKGKNHRALIIVSDGETHDEEAINRAKQAGKDGLLILCVGVGTPKGSFIPVSLGGKDDYKRDNTGNPVLTALNEAVMKEVSAGGNGTYFNLEQGSNSIISGLKAKIETLEKREFEQRIFDEFESYFQYWIGLGLLIILLEFIIPYRKFKNFDTNDIFDF